MVLPIRNQDLEKKSAEILMRRALDLARKGQGRTAPNPMVGAVIVNKGQVVGEGYHRQAGKPHAEIEALRKAGSRAQGGRMVLNLEPCCHHGRTPPCTEAIIKSGIREVVVGLRDPNPKVRGKGIRTLSTTLDFRALAFTWQPTSIMTLVNSIWASLCINLGKCTPPSFSGRTHTSTPNLCKRLMRDAAAWRDVT